MKAAAHAAASMSMVFARPSANPSRVFVSSADTASFPSRRHSLLRSALNGFFCTVSPGRHRPMTIDADLDFARLLADVASAHSLSYFRAELKRWTKADGSIATE